VAAVRGWAHDPEGVTVNSNAVTSNRQPVQQHVPGQTSGFEVEYEHERTRWTENAHRSDRTLWPDKVANPQRTRVL
jgi:hypothetical protein